MGKKNFSTTQQEYKFTQVGTSSVMKQKAKKYCCKQFKVKKKLSIQVLKNVTNFANVWAQKNVKR